MEENHQEEHYQELLRWIVTELAAGRSEVEVARDLEHWGLPRDTAENLVGQVAAAMAEEGQARPDGFQRVLGAVGGLVGMLVVFAVLNGILYLGQGIWKRSEVAEAERLEVQLNHLEFEIESVASWIEDMVMHSDMIDELGTRLDAPERHYSDQMSYEEDVGRYLLWVEEWNSDIVPQLASAVTRHDSLVDVFNRIVPEYNEIAASAYARWWLIPIPAPRGRGARTAR